MDHDEIRGRLTELATAQSAKGGRAVTAEADDNILRAFNFSSIDALEFLLEIEDAFGISFDDEDLNEGMLASADKLAAYVQSRRGMD